MRNLSRDKRGLSQVVTTLILLVVSVLLAGIVTYYATNITMTRTQQEEVRIAKQHVWVTSDGAAAAFMVQNLGGLDILIDKITVRGVECPWSSPAAVIQVTVEALGTGDGEILEFSGILKNPPVEPLSVGITVGIAAPIMDDGAGVFTEALVLSEGTINYVTGEWRLLFLAAAAPGVGEDITADYTGTTQVTNHYYLVQGDDDVTGDFDLTYTAGKFNAKIGDVPSGTDPSVWLDAVDDMPLKSSGVMLFLIEDPVNIGLNDVGTTVSITLFTTNGQWIVETNVESGL